MNQTHKYPPLQSFVDWLEAERGRSTALAQALNVPRSEVSNAKYGRKPIAEAWFQTIEKLSKKKITLRELHTHRVKSSLRNRQP